MDDAYIALHSARVLLSGSDSTFHVSGLTGATSPAYVGLIAALLLVQLSPVNALWLANALGTVAFLSGAWALTGSFGLSTIKRLIVVGSTLGAGYVWYQLTNGLETGWAMAALLWLLVCVKEKHTYAAALLVGVIPGFRPDLLPGAGLLLLVALRQEQDSRRRIAALALVLLVVLTFVGWVRIDTGRWVADTMRAKALYFAEGCLPVARKLGLSIGGVTIGLLALAPLCLGLVVLTRTPLGRLGLVAVCVTLATYAAIFPGALWHNHFRYLAAIVVPWAALGISTWLVERGRELTIGYAALAAIAFPLWRFPSRADAADLRAASSAVEQYVPRDATLLIQDAGAVSEFAHRRAVDFVGLKTPSSIDEHARWTWPSCGADRTHAIAVVARRAAASYALISTPWNEIFKLTDGLAKEGLALTVIWRQPPGTYGYRLYQIVDRGGETPPVGPSLTNP